MSRCNCNQHERPVLRTAGDKLLIIALRCSYCTSLAMERLRLSLARLPQIEPWHSMFAALEERASSSCPAQVGSEEQPATTDSNAWLSEALTQPAREPRPPRWWNRLAPPCLTLTLLLTLVGAGCTPHSVTPIPPSRPVQSVEVSNGLWRTIDKEAGVVIYSRWNGYGVAITAVPITETLLDCPLPQAEAQP